MQLEESTTLGGTLEATNKELEELRKELKAANDVKATALKDNQRLLEVLSP